MTDLEKCKQELAKLELQRKRYASDIALLEKKARKNKASPSDIALLKKMKDTLDVVPEFIKEVKELIRLLDKNSIAVYNCGKCVMNLLDKEHKDE